MNKSIEIQPWLNQFTGNQANQRLLEVFAIRGLATKEQCQSLQSELSEKQQRSLLANWSQEQVGRSPLLRTARTRYERQRGNPRLVYLLTETGASLLRELTGQSQLLVPKLESKTELAHAVAEVEVLALARQAQLKCALEQPFYFGTHQENIRADIALTLDGKVFRLIEIEQAAQADDLARLTDKLLRLLKFFRSNAAQPVENQLLVLFNLATEDQLTLSLWQKVITALEKQHGPLPYQLRTAPLLDFLGQPFWDDWSQYPRLQAEPTEALAEPEAATAETEMTPPFLRYRPAEASHFDLILEILKTDLLQTVTENAEENQRIFFNLALIIYAGSHYPDSPVVRKSAFPSISLALLYHYLHASQNQALLTILKREILELLRANARGANLFRDAFQHLAWTLLRQYGFGRGGPLQVQVKVPSFNDDRSDIHLELHWEAETSLQETYGLAVFALQKPVHKDEYQPYQPDWQSAPLKHNWQVLTAVAWLLNAIWVYREDLGLQPVNARKKKRA
jgi:hypothetical protein